MRKIILMNTVEENPFSIGLKVVLKENDVIEILLHETDPLGRYTPDELWKIKICNDALIEKGHAIMNDDEIRHMLDPYGTEVSEKFTEKEIQRLAGFEVEKTIKYLD